MGMDLLGTGMAELLEGHTFFRIVAVFLLMLSSGLNQILALVGSSRERSKLKVFLQMS